MESFQRHRGIAVPIDIPNCDTDQIIPARFLRKPVDDPEYSSFLLHDLRFDASGNENDFILNQGAFRSASVIVAERNWGCGSSRENAVTALQANGFRVVIAPSIADIHYNNCIKRGLLPIQLDAALCAELRAKLHESPGTEIAVDLDSQVVTGPGNWSAKFSIDTNHKVRLLKGLDEIDLTLEYETDIEAYESTRSTRLAWLP